MDSAGPIAVMEHTLDLVSRLLRQMVHEVTEPGDFAASILVAAGKVLAEARNIEPRNNLPFDIQAKAIREGEQNIAKLIEGMLAELRKLNDAPG